MNKNKMGTHCVTVLSFTALLALGGCNQSDPKSSATANSAAAGNTAKDACTLLTAEEIKGALGFNIGAPRPESLGDKVATCTWPETNGNPQAVYLMLQPATAPDYEAYVKQQRETLGASFRENELHRVDGLGDYAAWLGPRADHGVLQIAIKGRLLQVSATPVSGKKPYDVAHTLGKLAVARL